MTNTGLAGKGVLVAGASGGLGSEITELLALQNCSLMLIHREEDAKSESLKQRLKKTKSPAQFYECDFFNAEEIRDAIQIFFEEQKDPYAFINLLGDPARVDWEKAQISHFQESFLKNASAPLFSAKEFALKLRSQSRSGSIVLFSSMQGVYAFEGSLFYGTAKSALVHGTKILAKDFGGEPFIRINAVAPGVNDAGMAAESIRKGKYGKFVQQKIIPRYGEATDIARLVLFLLDPSLYMTGQTILFDGGLTLRRDLLR